MTLVGPSLRTWVTVSSPGTGNAAGRPVGFVVAAALHAVRAPSDSPPLSFSPEFSSLLPQPATTSANAPTVMHRLTIRPPSTRREGAHRAGSEGTVACPCAA